MENQILTDRKTLSHSLTPLFPHICGFSSRKIFEHSELFQKHRSELLRIEKGVEWRNDLKNDFDKDSLRVVSWNVERGKNLDGIIHAFQTDPILKAADVILLTETDIGMGRSGNRNVPFELSEAIGMNYVFNNSYIALTKGDEGEQDHGVENTLSLHGTTILSKYPFKAYKIQELTRAKDFFHHKEKRLGNKNALICTINLKGKDYDFGAVHIDLHSSPKQRATQMGCLMRALSDSQSEAQIIGGDFNSCTYDLKSKFRLAKNIFIKLCFGVKRVIEHYMKPDVYFEKPLFDELKKFGFDYDQYNDKSVGTLYFDLNEPVTDAKVRNKNTKQS